MELKPDFFTQFRGSTNFPGTLLLENPLFLDGHYLYGHSLELAYKGFLFRCGVTLKELKGVGHDLQKALNLAKDKGLCNYLCIDAAYETVVQQLNKYYFTKEFEYMTHTEKTFPLLMDVKDIVNRTINSLFTVLTEHL